MYRLAVEFGVDHGELDGLSRELCFVLGYEFHGFGQALHELERNKIRSSEGHGRFTYHTLNIGRMRVLAEKRGWVFTTFAGEDYPEWTKVRVLRKS